MTPHSCRQTALNKALWSQRHSRRQSFLPKAAESSYSWLSPRHSPFKATFKTLQTVKKWVREKTHPETVLCHV
jgi:hypothetical protein